MLQRAWPRATTAGVLARLTRQGGHPHPIRLLVAELAVELAAAKGGLSAVQHAHRPVDLGPSSEALKVPDLSTGGVLCGALG